MFNVIVRDIAKKNWQIQQLYNEHIYVNFFYFIFVDLSGHERKSDPHLFFPL